MAGIISDRTQRGTKGFLAAKKHKKAQIRAEKCLQRIWKLTYWRSWELVAFKIRLQEIHTVQFDKDKVFQLCDIVRETAYSIHCYHRHGHSEKIYENALIHRLRKCGIKAEQQLPIIVRDEDGTIFGDLKADVFVEAVLLIELKACKTILDEHIAQLLGYLREARIEHGLFINFGASSCR